MSRGVSLETKASFKNQYYNSNNKNNKKRIRSAYSFKVVASVLFDYHIKYMVFVEVTKGGFTLKEHTRGLCDSTSLVAGYYETKCIP